MSDRVFVRGFDYGTEEDAIKTHFEQDFRIDEIDGRTWENRGKSMKNR